jgi:hopene-associated glycosyltransferase HpnB
MPDPPEYLLLTDADIRCADDTLTSLIRRARGGNLALTSLMAKLRCVSFAERALIPAFVFFFQMLYPFAWARSPGRNTAAAAGGCMLVRRTALVDAGGIETIRSALIDDCALARLLKRKGAIWLGLTNRVESIREYPSLGDVRRMVVRSAYAQLGFRPFALAAATIAMIVIFLAPPLLALFGSGMAQLLGAIAWAWMTLAFLPMLRFYGVSPWWAVALPAIAAVYLAFTVDAAWQHGRNRGGAWKGRIHGGTSISR